MAARTSKFAVWHTNDIKGIQILHIAALRAAKSHSKVLLVSRRFPSLTTDT